MKFGEKLSINMQVYPSPVRDLLQVQLPEGIPGIISVRITDLQGRVVKSENISSDGNALATSLDIQVLPSGMYILEARTGKTSVTNRFIKQ